MDRHQEDHAIREFHLGLAVRSGAQYFDDDPLRTITNSPVQVQVRRTHDCRAHFEVQRFGHVVAHHHQVDFALPFHHR